MAEANKDSALKDAVRHKLISDKIKLWLAPYTQQGEEYGNYPEDLLSRYSSDLSIAVPLLKGILEELRIHALNKLAARKKFQVDGIASLKISLTGNVPDGIKSKCFKLEIKLSASGQMLKERISSEIKVTTNHMKLISCGRVLSDEVSLEAQSIRHQSKVMIICLSDSEIEAKEREKQHNRLQRTKEAAQLLAKRKDQTGKERERFYLQIADQTGKPIDLPDEEREALSIALTLHEKGRKCIKKKSMGEALPILLESDSAFRQCRSEILQAVDNYAILCLDIVWCYLCLQNVDQLPDADERLSICERSFEKAHGTNMERLATIKGSSSKDLVLYVRLYLMQGVVAYHKGNYELAQSLLNKAGDLTQSLQVDDDKMMQLMTMGFDMSEARLGLRTAFGNVSVAVTKITERRQVKQEIKEKEEQRRRTKRLERRLGKSANGEWVKVDVYNQLLSMGFPKKAVIHALRQTNSDLNRSIEVIQEHPELSLEPDTSQNQSSMWNGPITDDVIARMTEFGFDRNVAMEAFRRYAGNLERALEQLIRHRGVLPPMAAANSKNDSSDEEALTEEQQEAIAELQNDIPDHEEEYLNVTLEEEAAFIEEYKMMLTTVVKR